MADDAMESDGVPPLVGDERHALVDRLVAEFDAVVEAGVPRWVSLEAGPDWGKTRLVQELYGVLAARQEAPAYWPPTLWGAVTDGDRASLADVERRRNLLHPEVVHAEAGVVPRWFWWGITCATRSGTASQALLHDVGQFEAHQVGLEARWRDLVGFRARASRAVRDHLGELIETGGSEVISGVMPVPGLGLLLLAAKAGGHALKRHLDDGATEIDVSTRATLAAEELAPASPVHLG